MNSGALLVWAACGFAVIGSACGDDSAPQGSAGAGGDETDDANEPGGEAGVPAVAGAAGANAGGGGVAGAGGAPAGDQRVQEAAESGLREADVVVDAAALAGRSFELLSSLCVPDGAGGEGNIGGGPGGGDPLPMFHVREAAGGGLEAVTFTEDGGLPLVEVTPMHRNGLGWTVFNVATCASLQYGFEESYKTERYRAPSMHVVFVKGTESSALRAVVAARAGAGVRVSDGIVDELPPKVHAIDVEGRTDVDGVENWFTPQFVFSEPLPINTDVKVEDEDGNSVDVKPLIQSGYVVGFKVQDLISDAFEIGGFQDLAGNAFAAAVPYPGIRLTPADGTFEQAAQFVDSSAWDSDGYTPCETGTRTSVEELDLAPLTGTQSFLSGSADGYCSAWIRVEAPRGATELVFDARLIGASPQAAFDEVRVCVASLGVGGDDECTSIAGGWVKDPAYADPKPAVSVVRSLTVPLPDGATDVFVELAAGDRQRLWVDSLRTP